MSISMVQMRSRWLSSLLMSVVLFVTLTASALPSRAQTAAPTLSLVARGAGAALVNASDGTLVTTVGAGTRLTASERSADGAWFLVTTTSGKEGWVASADVLSFNAEALPAIEITITPMAAEITMDEDIPATDDEDEATATAAQVDMAHAAPISPTITVTVTSGTRSLNVRSGPGTGYSVINTANAGQTLTAQGRNATGSWLQIQLDNPEESGWVSAAYVAPNQSVDELTVVAMAERQAPIRSDPAKHTQTTTSTDHRSTGPTGLHGKLVLQISYGGLFQIYNLATGELRPLTHGFDPALSPDGQWVAFTRGGGEHGLYVINVDGSGERRVFGERQGFWSPKWSPDGQRIIFARWDSSTKCKDYSSRVGRYSCQQDQPGDGDLPYMMEVRPHLASVDLNGENYRDIATLHTASAPDWNEAGIVYASDGGIQITTPTGQEPSQLVHFDVYQQYYHDPDWQPGGGRIVLQQRRPSHWEIFAVNPDGSGYVQLTRPATVLVDALPSNVSPAWSPDGRHIVFLSNRTAENAAGAWRVWVMNADGSHQHPLPIELPFEYSFVEEQMIDWGP